MTLDEAIRHCYEVAGRKCDDCGKEHLQLAKWLEELKESRETLNRQKEEKQAMLDYIRCLEEKNEKQKAEIERFNQPILIAENVEINKEELIEKLRTAPIQILPGEKHYELRDCPFSPFDEYCTGHCVNCENWSEYVDLSKDLKIKAYKEIVGKLKEHLCSYDLPDYFSFEAVDEDTIDEVLKELVGENNGQTKALY